jgi:hypothetical protein
LRGRRALSVVLEDVEGDLLALGDELDRMTFHHHDLAAVFAFAGDLRGGVECDPHTK